MKNQGNLQVIRSDHQPNGGDDSKKDSSDVDNFINDHMHMMMNMDDD